MQIKTHNMGALFRARSLLPFSTRCRVRPPGYPHPLFLRTRTTDIPTYKKIFVDGEYDLDLAQPPRTIVDCGAHIGMASVYFAQRFPAARIVAIEPEPRNFALLARNVKTYPNITPIRAALWNDDTELDLVDPHHGTWAFRTEALKSNAAWGSLGRTPALTLDRIMAAYTIDFIDILKIDIEGAEKEVFENAASWIDKVGVIAIEIHNWRPGAPEAVDAAAGGFELRERQGENTLFFRTAAMKTAGAAATVGAVLAPPSPAPDHPA